MKTHHGNSPRQSFSVIRSNPANLLYPPDKTDRMCITSFTLRPARRPPQQKRPGSPRPLVQPLHHPRYDDAAPAQADGRSAFDSVLVPHAPHPEPGVEACLAAGLDAAALVDVAREVAHAVVCFFEENVAQEELTRRGEKGEGREGADGGVIDDKRREGGNKAR